MVVSTSRPQLHNGFKVSWKLCLNLCSRKWLRPTRSLVSNLIPSRLSILKMLLGLGRINFKMDFLNTSKLTEFRTLKSNLFHSVITDGKNVFLKKAVLVGS